MSFAVDTNVLLRSIDDGHAAQPVVNDGLLVLRSQGETLSIFPQNGSLVRPNPSTVADSVLG